MVERYVKRFAMLVSLLLGFFTGLVSTSFWETVLQYLNAVPFNVSDPIFNKDLSFYFFDLPFIQFIVGLGFWLLIISLVGVIINYILRGSLSFRVSQYPLKRMSILKALVIEKSAKIH